MLSPALLHSPTDQDVKGSLFLCVEVFPESFSSGVEHPLVTMVSSVGHYYGSHAPAECRSPHPNTCVLTVRPESCLSHLDFSSSLLVVCGSQEGLFHSNLIYILFPFYLTKEMASELLHITLHFRPSPNFLPNQRLVQKWHLNVLPEHNSSLL